MDNKSIKKQDWHAADIIAALHKQGITLTSLAGQTGISPSTFSQSLRKKHPMCEKIIADALNVKPSELWPSRWPPFSDMAESTLKATKAQPGLVFISHGNHVVTDSFHVAEHFEKHHDYVIQKIRNIACSVQFAHLNFKVCYRNTVLVNGKRQGFYEMTKDGFMFLVMDFTDPQAAEIKERYINAFNAMEAKLRGRRPAKIHDCCPLETADPSACEFANDLPGIGEILTGFNIFYIKNQ